MVTRTQSASEKSITTGKSRRAALDRPPKDLGDFLRHRLGIHWNDSCAENAELCHKKEDADTKSVCSDGHVFSDSDNESEESYNSTSIRDVINLLRECDHYDISRVVQQLCDMNCMIPIYYKCANESTENYLGSATHRYLKKGITVQGDDFQTLSRKEAIYLGDTALPWVVFSSLTKNSEESYINEVIGKLFEDTSLLSQTAEEDEDGNVSIEVGVFTLRKEHRTKSDFKHRNWMVFHIKGFSFKNNEHALSICNNADFVFTKIDRDSLDTFTNLRGDNKTWFGWQEGSTIGGKTKVKNAKGKSYSGIFKATIMNVAHVYSRKVLTGLNLKSSSERIALGTLFYNKNDDLTNYLDTIKQSIIHSHKNVRESLTLMHLNTLSEQSKQDQIFSEYRKQNNSSIQEIGEKFNSEAGNDPPATVKIMLNILRNPIRSYRLLGMYELGTALNQSENNLLQQEITRVSEAEKCRSEEGLSDKNSRMELMEARDALQKKQTDVVHIWRELGLRYSARNSCKSKPHFHEYNESPSLAAQYLCDGGTLELVDGDSGFVNSEWMEAVMKKMSKILKEQIGKDATIIVNSVTGVQSCGKSTALNAMYGANMKTSHGCCTRGINIALIHSECAWQSKADYVLLMDTEGICNPLFLGQKWYDWKNNWLTSIAVLSADVSCVLSNNEDDTIVRQTLPFAILCHANSQQTLSSLGFMQRRLFFVYNRIDPAEAKTALNANRISMMDHLRENQELVSQFSRIESANRGNIFRLVEESDFHYLGPNLNDSEGYGEQVVKLRQSMDKALAKDGFQPSTVLQWWYIFSSLKSALDNQNHALSFKDIIEMRFATDREKKINDLKLLVGQKWRDIFTEVTDRIKVEFSKDGKLEVSVDQRLDELQPIGVKHYEDSQTQELKHYLAGMGHEHAVTRELELWTLFLEQIRSRYTRDLEKIYNAYSNGRKQEGDMIKTLEEQLDACMQDKEQRAHLRNNSEAQLKTFDAIFNKSLVRLSVDYPTRDVRNEISNALPKEFHKASDNMKSHFKSGIKSSIKSITFFWTDSENNHCYNDVQLQVESLCTLWDDDINGMRFENSILWKALDLILNSKLDKASQVELWKDARKRIIESLVKMHTRWESEHNLYNCFKSRRNAMLNRFQIICKGQDEYHTALDILITTLWDSSIQIYCEHVATRECFELFEKQNWWKESPVLTAHINLSLLKMIEENKVEECIVAMRDSKYFEEIQENLLKQMMAEKAPSNEIHDLCKSELIAFFSQTCIDKIKGKMQTSGFDGKISGEVFADILFGLNGLEFEHSVIQRISQIASLDAIATMNTIIKSFADRWPEINSCLWHDKYTPSWGTIVKDSAVKTKTLCCARCPICGAQCRKSAHDKNEKHDAFHQPQGLNGWRYLSANPPHPYANMLVETCCTHQYGIIGSEFKHNNSFVLMADYEKVFPEWAKPVNKMADKYKANEEFRTVFFAEYQDQFAKYFNTKKNTNISEVHRPMFEIKQDLENIVNEHDP